MNPLDKEEFTNLLQDIKKDMPIITDNSMSVKMSYSMGFPKDMKEHSIKIDDKFLNDNQNIIEEIIHRDPNNVFVKQFRNYQLKNYFDSGILNKDNFFKATLHDTWRECYEKGIPFPKISGSMRSMSIQNAGFLGIPKIITGTELSTNYTDTTHNPNGNLNCRCSKLSGGTIGAIYNRIKLRMFAANGNYKFGAYNDSAGVPSGRYAQTGSLTAVSDTYQSISNFEITQTVFWVADIGDTDSGCDNYYENGTGARSSNNATTFGAQFVNPWVQVSPDGYPDQMKATYV